MLLFIFGYGYVVQRVQINISHSIYQEGQSRLEFQQDKRVLSLSRFKTKTQSRPSLIYTH